MSLINKEVSDFSVMAYQDDDFRQVTKEDIMGMSHGVRRSPE